MPVMANPDADLLWDVIVKLLGPSAVRLAG
jgi:hypothetical protein